MPRPNPQPARIARWVRGHAGDWGLPGPMIRRPPVAPVSAFTRPVRLAIRPGEGTLTAVVPASGTVQLALGPDALITWYVTYVAISTTLGAADSSTCAASVGPYAAGINPAGQAYNGGGDVISMAGRALKPGEYINLVWSGATPGNLAIATVYGDQVVLT